jgi:membrane-associated protease RseP (regulator of RpoE activity)
VSEVVAYAAGVLVLVLGLAVSIALHEVGHLVPAKRFGVKVTQYMVGFGPTLFSRRRGETEYGVKAVPLGGYVRMIGMFAPEPGGRVRAGSTSPFSQLADDARRAVREEIGPDDDARTFYRLPVRKRIVVMLGGPLMNLGLAVVLLGLLLTTIGTAGLTPRVAEVSACVLPAAAAPAQAGGEAPACGPDDPPTPAARAGLLAGDVLLEVDGTAVDGSWERATTAIRAAAGRTVDVVVDRDGERLVLRADVIRTERPVLDAGGAPVLGADGEVRTEPAGFLGVSPTEALVPQPVTAVPGFVAEATWRTAGIVLTLPARMVQVAQAAFGEEERDPNGPIGLVGVGRLSGEVATTDLLETTAERVGTMLGILGSLNLALFVFNLVPLLPLDGGHVAGALLEGARRAVARVRGRPDPGPFDLARLLPLTYAVVAVFLAMSLLLLYADIVNPVTLG